MLVDNYYMIYNYIKIIETITLYFITIMLLNIFCTIHVDTRQNDFTSNDLNIYVRNFTQLLSRMTNFYVKPFNLH